MRYYWTNNINQEIRKSLCWWRGTTQLDYNSHKNPLMMVPVKTFVRCIYCSSFKLKLKIHLRQLIIIQTGAYKLTDPLMSTVYIRTHFESDKNFSVLHFNKDYDPYGWKMDLCCYCPNSVIKYCFSKYELDNACVITEKDLHLNILDEVGDCVEYLYKWSLISGSH